MKRIASVFVAGVCSAADAQSVTIRFIPEDEVIATFGGTTTVTIVAEVSDAVAFAAYWFDIKVVGAGAQATEFAFLNGVGNLSLPPVATGDGGWEDVQTYNVPLLIGGTALNPIPLAQYTHVSAGFGYVDITAEVNASSPTPGASVYLSDDAFDRTSVPTTVVGARIYQVPASGVLGLISMAGIGTCRRGRKAPSAS